jgi:hypothetical protein
MDLDVTSIVYSPEAFGVYASGLMWSKIRVKASLFALAVKRHTRAELADVRRSACRNVFHLCTRMSHMGFTGSDQTGVRRSGLGELQPTAKAGR